MTGTVVALLLLLVPGWCALKCIGAPRRSSRFEVLSLSYGLGVGAVAMLLFFLSCAGVRLSRGPVLLAAVALSTLLCVLWLVRRRRMGERGTIESPGPRLSRLEVFLLVLLILLFLSQAYFAVSTPLSAMDAMGFWGYSAKAVFFDGSIRTPALVDPLRSHPHPRYPLLVPLAQDWVHFLRNRYDDGSVRLLFVGFYAALLGVIYGTVRRRWGRRAGVLAACLVASIPALRADGFGATFALADIPLAFFIAAALAGWLRWMDEGRSRDLLLAFIFAALGAWTKNEGLAALAILTVLVVAEEARLLWTVRQARGPEPRRGAVPPGARDRPPSESPARQPGARRPADRRSLPGSRRRRLGLVLAVAVVGWALVVPWLLFRAGLPATDENYPSHIRLAVFIANVDRLPTIGWAWLREVADASQWSILWLLAVVAGLWAIGRPASRRAPACWLGAFALAQVLVYTVIYVIAPWDIADLLELTATRLLIHVMPPALLLCCLVVPEAWSRTPWNPNAQ